MRVLMELAALLAAWALTSGIVFLAVAWRVW